MADLKAKTLRQQLIISAELFCTEQGISKARLSSIVCDRGSFFKKIEAGGDCTTAMFERFQKVFSCPQAWQAARAAERLRRGVKASPEVSSCAP